MLKLIVICSAKVGDHGAVETSDDNTTATGELILVDAVFGQDTFLCTGIGNLFTEGIFANTADVDDRLRRESVLYPGLNTVF